MTALRKFCTAVPIAGVCFSVLEAIGRSYSDIGDQPLPVALLVLALFLLMLAAIAMTPVYAVMAWRDYRRARGHFTEQERAAQIREADLHASYMTGRAKARHLAGQLGAGRSPQPIAPRGVVLGDGEDGYLDLPVSYARFHSLGNGTYQHVSGLYVGRPGFVIAGLAANAIGNAARRSQARSDAMQAWRSHQAARIVATDRRLLCHVGGTWLSFYFTHVTAFHPEPDNCSIILEFEDTSPLLLAGPNAPLLAVYLTWRLHGTSAFSEHPALASLLR
jgi:hypothetical protein